MAFIPGYPVEPTDIDRRIAPFGGHARLSASSPTWRSTTTRSGHSGPRTGWTLAQLRPRRHLRGTVPRRALAHDHRQHQLPPETRQPHGPWHHRARSSTGRSPSSRPFTLAGAMAPVTIAGRTWRSRMRSFWLACRSPSAREPGAPVVYGGFTSNVDMKTGAPAFGTPEYVKAAQAGGTADPPLWCPLPLVRRLRREHPRRAGRLGDADVAVGHHDRRGRYGHARRRVDGRADSGCVV